MTLDALKVILNAWPAPPAQPTASYGFLLGLIFDDLVFLSQWFVR